MFVMNNQEIKGKIYEKITRCIQEIIDGYKIIHQEEDGCDEYGFLYWVECENGFNMREHDIETYMKKDILNYLQNCVLGITINHNDNDYEYQLSENIIYMKTFGIDDINILTKDEIDERNNIIEKIKPLKQRFLKSLDNTFKKDSGYNMDRFLGGLAFKNEICTLNFKDFVNSLFITFNTIDFVYKNIINNSYNKKLIISILKKSELSDEENTKLKNIFKSLPQ